jgi:hypothetical protein
MIIRVERSVFFYLIIKYINGPDFWRLVPLFYGINHGSYIMRNEIQCSLNVFLDQMEELFFLFAK